MSEVLVPSASPIRLPSQNEIVWALVQGWWIVLISVVGFVVWGANYLHSEAPMYQAQIQVTPAQQGGGGTAAGGGLAAAAAAALNLNGPSVTQGNDFQLYLNSFASRDLADVLAQSFGS